MPLNRKLPVLEALTSLVKLSSALDIKKILFVCVQHLLYTSIDLFETLIELGAVPHNIFLIGKHYSTCPAVVEQITDMGIQLQKLTPLEGLGNYIPIFNQDILNMWEQVQKHITKYQHIEAVIVLDDGGRCLEFITQGILKELPVIGIEQTTAGLFNPAVVNLHVPFIDVAACAAKIYLESDMIVEAIFQKLNEIIPSERMGLKCGVVGVGVIGRAVAKQLLSLGCNVLIFDQIKDNYKDVKEAIYCANLSELIRQADYIFGCTGRDIIKNIDIEATIIVNKTFISCTSEDKEFNTLLKYIQNTNSANIKFDPLKSASLKLPNGATITLVKGGFPINFDDSGESVPAKKIQLTRGLLLAALIQAIEDLPYLREAGIKGRVMLHPEAQRFIVRHWLKANNNHKFSQELLAKFDNIKWVTSNSGGIYYESNFIRKYFHEDLLASVYEANS